MVSIFPGHVSWTRAGAMRGGTYFGAEGERISQYKERMSNRSMIVCQSLASQSARNLEISRRFSTDLKIECPSVRDVGKTVNIDTWTDQDGAEDELERHPQESRCNDSEPLTQKQKQKNCQHTTQEVGERSQGWIELRAGKVGNFWGTRRTTVE